MNSSALAITIILALVVGLLVLPMTLSALWYRFHPARPRGVRFSPKAAQWAESRFPAELRPIAAFAADLLRDQLGVGFAQLEPQTRFIEDLGMDDLEPVEVVMALEEELDIEIPDADAKPLLTVSELVDYLHHRLHAPNKVA